MGLNKQKPLILSLVFVSLLCLNFKDMHEDTKEIWKEIPKYSRYQASNMGRIKSLFYPKAPYILKHHINKKGYHHVSLKRDCDNKSIPLRVHRIIAHTYIQNPNNKPFINHIDGDKSNNRPENLEWCTQQENVQHAHANNLVKRHTLTLNIETGIFYDTIKEAAQTHNLNVKKLTNMLCGWQKNTSKFIAVR